MKKQIKDKIKGTSIAVRNGNIEGALQAFKNVVYKSEKIKEVYDRQFFTKPSIKRRKEKINAIYVQTFETARSNM